MHILIYITQSGQILQLILTNSEGQKDVGEMMFK